MKAIEAIGGYRPVETEELARRASAFVLQPTGNPLKAVLDQAASIEKAPPLLGVFNDIPWHRFREDEAHAWARAGFSWVVNDAEHSQGEAWYGREHNAALARLGLTPVQRLPREAVSQHGDAMQLGARATMRPYATSFEEAEVYYRAIAFPVPGETTRHSRGAYPMRGGDRVSTPTLEALRDAETQTQGWLQFETSELILDLGLRDRVLELMAAQGRNRACGFVGALDATLREPDAARVESGIARLFEAAMHHGVPMGRVVGGGVRQGPQEVEDAMVAAIEGGARLIAVHHLTSDLPFHGALAAAEPFFRAARRCGF